MAETTTQLRQQAILGCPAAILYEKIQTGAKRASDASDFFGFSIVLPLAKQHGQPWLRVISTDG